MGKKACLTHPSRGLPHCGLNRPSTSVPGMKKKTVIQRARGMFRQERRSKDNKQGYTKVKKDLQAILTRKSKKA